MKASYNYCYHTSGNTCTCKCKCIWFVRLALNVCLDLMSCFPNNGEPHCHSGTSTVQGGGQILTPLPPPECNPALSPIPTSCQRFKMERKLERELKQTEAVESREKKSKVVYAYCMNLCTMLP